MIDVVYLVVVVVVRGVGCGVGGGVRAGVGCASVLNTVSHFVLRSFLKFPYSLEVKIALSGFF